MANFSLNSLSYLDHNNNNDINWDLLNPFISMNNQSLVQTSLMDYQTLMGDHQILTQQSSLLQDKLSGMNTQLEAADPPTISELVDPVLSYGSRNLERSGGATITKNKRKAEEYAESTSLNSSSPLSTSDGNTKKNSSGRGKRAKCNDKAGEKPNEVVHVRARRGQATDSHSIAERIRRGKINERLKCLQDIVPGCNKTMGMAVMLDEIINYVQSLQNQVEFLSMKLTAASQFHDFNADTDDIVEKLQKTNGLNGNNDTQNMESTISRKGYDQIVNFTQQTWPF